MTSRVPIQVEIELDSGIAIAELDPIRAPQGAEAFLSLVDRAGYDGAHIYRRVRTDEAPAGTPGIDVVQFGLALKSLTQEVPASLVPHEPTHQTGLNHVRGALSFARLEPGTATSEVFVTLRDSPELDHGGARQRDGQGFSVFGRIVEGLELFEAIHAAQTQEYFLKPIEIIGIRRLARADE